MVAWPASVLIIGCGNMGGAMLAGWLAAGIPAERFTVVDPVLAATPDGVRLERSLPEGERFDLLLLGVKPQMLDGVAPALTALADGAVVLSILAGVELGSLAARFAKARGIVRVMPNLAAAIGRSPMGVAAVGLDDGDKAGITALLTPLGTPEWLDESLFDAVTALAGSGPAFVYRFIQALAAGGEASRVVFSGVGKTAAEIRRGIEAGIGQFNLESEEEGLELSELAAERGQVASCALRVNPDIDAGTHEKISTGKADNKFGVPIDMAVSMYMR